MKELVRYTKAADQARLARNALAKAITRTKGLARPATVTAIQDQHGK